MARRSKARSLSIAIRQSPVLAAAIESPDDTAAFATAINTASGGAVGAGGSESVATAADLPLTDNEAGDFAFVEETNRLYIWNGNGWYNIALINTSPSIVQAGSAEYSFLTDGTPIVVTLQATDPEEVAIQWSYEVTSGSATNVATIEQNNNVFTLTPTTDTNYPGQFTVTFTASDGVNIDTASSQFSLTFSAPPSGVRFTTTGTRTWTVPDGVFEINVVAIGAGGGGGFGNTYTDRAGVGGCGGALAYLNNISVDPGDILEIGVGEGSSAVGYNVSSVPGGDSYVKRTTLSSGESVDQMMVHAGGGSGGKTTNKNYNSGNGNHYIYGGNIPGPTGTAYPNDWPGSSGTAYSGGGLVFPSPIAYNTNRNAHRETGGGSAANYTSNGANATLLAFNNLDGEGTSEYGQNEGLWGYGGRGGRYGADPTDGQNGIVRIIWGDNNNIRAFPDANAGLASSTSGETTI